MTYNLKVTGDLTVSTPDKYDSVLSEVEAYNHLKSIGYKGDQLDRQTKNLLCDFSKEGILSALVGHIEGTQDFRGSLLSLEELLISVYEAGYTDCQIHQKRYEKTLSEDNFEKILPTYSN